MRRVGSGRRDALFLAAGLFCAYAYFYQAGGWNQNTRFALARAIVEQGTLYLDDTGRFEGRSVTGDFSRCGPHICSDKAPGQPLAAAAIIALVRPAVPNPESRAGIVVLSYLATLALSALPTVAAALLLFHLASTSGASAGGAAFAALTLGLATPAWAYATLFWSHALAMFCLLAAFCAAFALREDRGPRRDATLGLTVGLAAGWGTVTEYPTAIPAVIVAVLALAHAWQGGRARRLRIGVAVLSGGLTCLVVLLLYNVAAFGEPLALSYETKEAFGGMQSGFMGVTYPRAAALWGITFGRYRGLFFLAPVLAIGAASLALLPRRPVVWAVIGIVVYYFLFNGAYYYWDAGWSYGPRLMSPLLPFLCWPLALLWTRAQPRFRAALGGLALWGAALALMAVATTAQPPQQFTDPVRDLFWPNFVAGRVSLNHQAFFEVLPVQGRDPLVHAWNLGERLGLAGMASLIPLGVAWLLIFAAWWAGRRPPPS